MSDRSVDPTYYDQVSERKTGALIRILEMRRTNDIRNLLVVGCGEGLEAGILARAFGARATGIDTCQGFEFDVDGSYPAELRVMDARHLEFPNESFDLVYSFHALEHIPGPEAALREMARVLRPGGAYLIGTPNKSRLIGYVGSATSLGTKIHWNLIDVSKRLRGKWSNEAGAHAGFTEAELQSLCGASFGDTPESVSTEYYREIYPKWPIDTIERLGLAPVLYPCVYVSGSKA